MITSRRSRVPRVAPAFLAVCLLLGAFAAPSEAAFIDIVVLGTWESTNVNTTINPFGLANGDKFVMKATYDDTTLFNGSEGVTATLDPTVNAGTSLDVIIPVATGAPNPIEFDHTDHTSIGFAPNAQIEFTGTDATTDPGVFRNFEIHVDFSWGGQQFDFDTFMGGIQEETDLFNESQGFNLAAVGDGAEHLEVVVNDVTANAGGPYVFNAATLSQNLNGSYTGGNGFGAGLDWNGGALATGASPLVDIADLGLTGTADTTNILLDVTENFTDFSDTDMAMASYVNAAPSVLTAGAVDEIDGSVTFSATADDADLAANALVAGFESLLIEFLFGGSVFLTGNGNVDIATLLAITGGEGLFEFEARVTDLEGAMNSSLFNHLVVPEPNLALLLTCGLIGLGVRRRLH